MHTTPIRYHLDTHRYNQHILEVTLTFTAHNDAPILWMPSWIPGSYLMREFARNITALHYRVNSKANNDDSKTKINESAPLQRAQKISKNEWQLGAHAKTDHQPIKEGDIVEVSYEVYCYDLSVRTAYVDQYRIYGNFTSLALAVEGQQVNPVQVIMTVPEQFYIDANKAQQTATPMLKPSSEAQVKLVCGLDVVHLHTDNAHQFSIEADSYDDLIDFPFELSYQDEFEFIISDNKHDALVHRFSISGAHQANMGRLQIDLTQICQTYLNWLGDAPFEHYTFMTYASGNDYGGLEHINSTSLITPRSDLPIPSEADEPSESYQRFLGLCSHEYFHAWWVKTVRPDVMMNTDLRTEAYTPLLWVFEGFTSYIDDFMLQASKVINNESYLKLLTAQINRYQQTKGRALQSVAESSFDAWVKLYRADENTGNAGISYYNKGALVALCLDLLLIKHSKGEYRIFDVVEAFYHQAKQQPNQGNPQRIGMSEASLDSVIGEYMPIDVWQQFASNYVYGTQELPIKEMLIEHGVNFSEQDKDNTLPWGISADDSAGGLKVNKVLRDSVASEAGLSAKDVIVAIDGIKANKAHLTRISETMSKQEKEVRVSCHAFRRDQLIVLNVSNQSATGISANPSLEKIELSLNETGFEGWLAPSFVEK